MNGGWPALPTNIEAQLIAATMRMRIERIRLCVEELQMAEKMPNVSGLASEIDKLTFAIEADAKKRLERVLAIHEKRQRVFGKADAKLDARDASLDEADVALDKLDEALGDNGGPTLGDSSQSPAQPPASAATSAPAANAVQQPKDYT